jgi:hypothetical protein
MDDETRKAAIDAFNDLGALNGASVQLANNGRLWVELAGSHHTDQIEEVLAVARKHGFDVEAAGRLELWPRRGDS